MMTPNRPGFCVVCDREIPDDVRYKYGFVCNITCQLQASLYGVDELIRIVEAGFVDNTERRQFIETCRREIDRCYDNVEYSRPMGVTPPAPEKREQPKIVKTLTPSPWLFYAGKDDNEVIDHLLMTV